MQYGSHVLSVRVLSSYKSRPAREDIFTVLERRFVVPQQDKSNLNFLLLYRMHKELLQYGPQSSSDLIWNNTKIFFFCFSFSRFIACSNGAKIVNQAIRACGKARQYLSALLGSQGSTAVNIHKGETACQGGVREHVTGLRGFRVQCSSSKKWKKNSLHFYKLPISISNFCPQGQAF